MHIKDNGLYYTLSAAATCILGVFLYFLYRLYPGFFTALISPTNSSVFEYTKLLFWPLLIFMSVHELLHRDGDFERHTLYLFISVAACVAVYYLIDRTSSGPKFLPFLAGTALFFALSFRTRHDRRPRSVFSSVIAPIVMIVMLTLIVAFTFNPPELPLFFDPLTNTYGI